MSLGTPRSEVDVDGVLLRGLLADQHPDLAGLPIAPLDTGWDNVMFRLGEAFTVRLPRRAAAAQLILNEQAWLPGLAPTLPIRVPAVVRAGAPGRGYPWSWSILPFIAGRPADESPPAPTEAPRLAAFLRALHKPTPAEAPPNPVRGVPLADRAPQVEERLERLRGKTRIVGDEIGAIWRRALAAPVSAERVWLHGDLHARNVLTASSELSGVVDWGDITAGDAATDLASIWMLFEDAYARRRALAHYDPDEALAARARGWAILFGAVLLDTGLVDNPRHAAMGAATLRRVAADG
jgi:aminoglycoside phosphotransferase (APT) family kinase protein